MSRIGKTPIIIPNDVEVELKGDLLKVRGSKGELSRKIHPGVTLNVDSKQLLIGVQDGSRESRALHGLYRALIANMVTGVSSGFEKVLARKV